MKPTTQDRFWQKVARKGHDDCWLWQACVGSDGYGHFRLSGKVCAAHVVSFELSSGLVPPGQVVMHSCDNPLCCNPSHLSTGTRLENIHDMVNKDRHRSPRPGNGYTKLTKAMLEEIVALYSGGTTNKSKIARMYGVSPTHIRQILQKVGLK